MTQSQVPTWPCAGPAALCTAMHALPQPPIHCMPMAAHTTCNIPTTQNSCVYHTCTHFNPHIRPANDTVTASHMAVQSLNPVYSPAFPTTAIRHCIRMIAHTSCNIPTTHTLCHASETHVNPYMTPANDTVTGPHMALCRPCSSVYMPHHSHQTLNAHISTHFMRYPHDPHAMPCTPNTFQPPHKACE